MARPDLTTVEIIRNSLIYASEEMGVALRNSAYSPNIRERMDHSAAIFDDKGRLLAQAEHIPVHLGSLPWGLVNTIRYCDKVGIDLDSSCMIMVNNPYISGTHLNDLTIIRPIFHANKLVAYAANKAHHSDVGGKVPGSISADAKTLFEEGIVVNPTYLIRKNRLLSNRVKEFISSSRTPRERAGDLKAQTAANITGERRVLDLVRKYGSSIFREASQESLIKTEQLSRLRINRFPKGQFKAEDFLEAPDGRDIRLKVTITMSNRGLHIDYTGTSNQVSNPLNAVFGVTLSGVYYVSRTLIGDDVPANQGAFSAISVFAPSGTILNPTFPHPVAGGNLETSQRNADLLYKAFAKALPDKVPADAGGSMNNMMIGGKWRHKKWAFYETIGVGTGASNDNDGIDGIQANMTNTMNTPIEEIERSYPLLVTQYELRPDSSGAGRHRGGSGIIRSYQAIGDDTVLTVLADRGKNNPQGLFKGGPAEHTRVILHRRGKHGELQQPVKISLILEKRDRLEIRTAGGGGYGNPGQRSVSDLKHDLETELVTSQYVRRQYHYRFPNL